MFKLCRHEQNEGRKTLVWSLFIKESQQTLSKTNFFSPQRIQIVGKTEATRIQLNRFIDMENTHLN